MIFLIFLQKVVSISNLALSFTPTMISTLASYTISFTFDNSIPGTSTVRLVFPSVVSIENSSSAQCSVNSQIYNPTSLGVSCSVSSNIFTVTGVFGSTPDQIDPISIPITITLNKITNPPSTMSSSSIQMFIYNPDGSTAESDTNNANMQITASAGYFTGASIAASSNVIGALNIWTFSVTTSQTVPVGSSLQVKFPYWNQYIGATSANLMHFIRTSNPACTGVSNIGSSISCTYQSSSQFLTITNGFTSSATGNIIWTVSNIFNPPTSDALSGFSIIIIDQNSNEFLKTQSDLSIQATSPNTVGFSGTSFSATNSTVSTSTQGFLTFTLSNPTYSGLALEITFPSDITVSPTASITGVSNFATSGLVYTISGNNIKITNGWSVYNFYSTPISIKIDPVTTASSTTPTDNFSILTRSPNGNPVDSGSGGSAQARSGTIYQFQNNPFFTSTDLTVGSTGTYRFNMLLSHPVMAGGALVIVFPSQFTVASRSSTTPCPSISAGLTAGAYCSVTSNTLTVINGFVRAFSGGQVSFSIDQVTNPPTTARTSSFAIYSKTNSAGTYNIDTVTTGITMTPAPALMVSASVSSSSVVTGFVSTYSFSLTTKNTIPNSGYLVVTFPAEITQWSTSSSLASCSSTSGFPGSITCALSGSNIKITGFTSDFNPGTLAWTMGSIMNPQTTATSSTFKFYSYDSLGNLIDQKVTGVTITLTDANLFLAATVSPSSLFNGAVCDYTFSFNNRLSMPNNSYIYIVAPSQVSLPPTPTCSVSSGLTSVQCISSSSNTLTATLFFSSSDLAASSSFSFKVLSVKNPGTTKPSSSFLAYSFTTLGYKIEKIESGITITNTNAGLVQQITIGATDSRITMPTSYLLTYVPVDIHPAGSIMYIQIPGEFKLGSISCQAVGSGLSPTATCSLSGSSLTVTSAFNSEVAAATSVSLQINGLTNPTSQIATSAWTLLTKTSDGYLIDTSTSYVSTFSCGANCLTCNLNYANCTSCDSNSGYPYLYNSSCNSYCVDGYTDDVSTNTKECVKCDNKCLTCVDNSTTCTKCNTLGLYPYLYSYTCNANCLSGYYGNGTHCNLCLNPCLTCSNATFCLSCAVSSVTQVQTYLWSGACYSVCPAGTTANLSSKSCVLCISPCANCSSSPSTCTACVSPLKLLGSSCVNSCPTNGTYIETSTQCQPCQSPCATCANDIVSCTSCVSSYSLLQSSCVQLCPTGYVDINKVCLTCTSPCSACNASQTTCTSCVDGYFLQINQCVLSCSTGFYLSGVACLACSSQCLTCSLLSSACSTCTNGLYLFNSTCVSSCQASYYIQSNGACLPCQSPCLTCSVNTTYCNTCLNGMFLYQGNCFSACPDLISIPNPTTYTCQLCNSNCKTCSLNVNNCTSCYSGFYMQGSFCVSSCSAGYYLASSICQLCESGCATCSGTSNNCQSCSSNFYLLNNSCISSCPEGYKPSSSQCVVAPIVECSPGCGSPIYYNTLCDLVCNTTTCAYDNGQCIRITVSCGSNKYEQGGSCFNCSTPCSNCIGSATNCTSCLPDGSGALQYLFNNTCYTTCPTATYPSGVLCLPCSTYCLSCVSSSSICTSCVAGYKLYNNQCILNCPPLVTVANGASECSGCDVECKNCEGSVDNCTLCYSPMVLQGNKCNPYCDSGYTNITGICVKCIGCLECSGSASFCVKCTAGLFLYKGNCVNVCPDGTYYGTEACQTCGATCQTCADSISCNSCKSGNYLFENACVPQCPSGYLVSLGVCVLGNSNSPCNTGCTVSLLTNNICDIVCNVSSCNFDNQQCKLGSCPSGMFLSNSGQCQACVYPCKQCTSVILCTSCSASISTGQLLLLNGTNCVEPSLCTNGFLQSGVFCTACSGNCGTCSGQSNTCTSCNSGNFLYNSTCVASCPSAVTVLKGTTCLFCSSNCATCSGNYDYCSTCVSPSVLQGSVCKPNCDSGYTLTPSSSSVCQSCTNNCTTCSSSTSTCLSCTAGLFLSGSSCVQYCPANTTVLVGFTCVPCKSSCATCRNTITNCLTCNTGFYLFGTDCLEACPSGYEINQNQCTAYCSEGCTQPMLHNTVCDKFCNTADCLFDNYICLGSTTCSYGQYQNGTDCKNCSFPCQTCASSVYCTSCQLTANNNSMVLYKGACSLNCPSGTYQNGLQCFVCSSLCAECSGSASFCVKCFSGMKLYQDSCIMSCPSGVTVEINGVCFDCDSNCAECAGSINICTKCLTGLVLSEGRCISQCLAGYTLTNTSGSTCVKCNGCQTCLGSEFYCLTCPTNSVILQNTCYLTCPAGYTNTTTSSGVCIFCSSSCKQCSGDINKCTACYIGKVLNSYNQCVDPPACPSGQISDSHGVCQSCDSNCTQCFVNTTNCISCPQSYFLSSGRCYSCSPSCLNCKNSANYCTQCNNGYYSSLGNCISCLPSCQTCSNGQSCLTCKLQLFLQGGSCLECMPNCDLCLDQFTCSQCSLGFYLSSGSCLQCSDPCVGCSSVSTFCTVCKPGLYADVTGSCVSCSTSCFTCVGNANNCTACSTGQVLINSLCGSCKTGCLDCKNNFNLCSSCSATQILISGQCGTCQGGCLTCSSSFVACDSCKEGYFLFGSSCIACTSPCLTCVGTAMNCTSCTGNTVLINNVCSQCSSNCTTCQGQPTNCDSCPSGYFISGGKCLPCDSLCKTCTDFSSNCLSCSSGYYLSGHTCQVCEYPCVTCVVSAKYCISCPPQSTAQNGLCAKSCPSGTLQVNMTCEPCDPICRTCSGTASSCLTCASGLTFNNSCVLSCPDSYFSSKGVCIPCSTECYNCTGTETQCTSCLTGYKLKGSTCEVICPTGQYPLGGICLKCDSTCETCYGSSITCQKCSNSTWVLMNDGICTAPCPYGYLRLTSSSQCEVCSNDCQECSVYLNNCTSCRNQAMFLYNGTCIPACPTGITVVKGRNCYGCSQNCKYCSGSITNCTDCLSGTYLLNGSCIDNCPENYMPSGSVCLKCLHLNCSNISSSGNQTINVTNPMFKAGPVPFPFSGVSFISTGVIALAKLTTDGIQMVPSTIGVWGALSSVSWVFLSIYIPQQGSHGNFRRLTQIDAVGGDVVLTIAFFLIIGGLTFHIFCNIFFFVSYLLKVIRNDKSYAYWRSSHKGCNLVIVILSAVLSFHSIRLLFSGMFGYSGFKVTYDDKRKVYKPLILCGYISVLCTFIPIFIAEILILCIISVYYWLWMFTLDSLIITFLLAVLVLNDIKRREKELMQVDYERKLALPNYEKGLIEEGNSIKELIELFPQIDFSELVPLTLVKRPIKKKISKSNPESKCSSPNSARLRRNGSFPLMAEDRVEIFPETLKPVPEAEPVGVKSEEPFGEEILDKSVEKDELTMIIEDLNIEAQPEETREFEVSFMESKNPKIRATEIEFFPINLDYKVEEYTEIVAYTEEDEPSEEKIDPIEASPEALVEDLIQLSPDKEEDSNIKEEKKVEETEDIEELLFEFQSESQKDLNAFRDDPIEPLKEETDIDLEKAIPDPKDNELISVFHKPTGQRVTIRKGFKGARIVDLENKVIESMPPIDTVKFEQDKTIVDEQDVRFATMTAKTGEKVRVKRSFKGARIVDLEKKITNPHSYLIGETVKNEADFQFTNAYPDPDDPEVVVVMHNETGEDVKIRKTFQGAVVVDEAGEPLPNMPGIERNDYDIQKAIIDKDDVHLATLKHKVTRRNVKVRRNFRGAKIIDLERKVEYPKYQQELSEKSDEPEQISPREDDFGWVVPKKESKKPLKPISISPKEEIYDRRKLANLANLIDDLDEDPVGWPGQRIISGSSSEDLDSQKPFYHNIDLEQVNVPNYDSDSNSDVFQMSRKKLKRPKKKKTKKVLPPDSSRMKGLEDIYLRRIENKKKQTGLRMTGEIGFEPEWERTDSGFEVRDRNFPSAAEEIINPRFKNMTPKSFFK